jgi:hypothetical protein
MLASTTDDDMADLSEDELFNSLIVHLVLPPKCPQHRDPQLLEINSRLLALIHDSVVSFSDQCSDEHKPGWQSMNQVFSHWVQIQQKNSIVEEKLDEALMALPVHGGFPKHFSSSAFSSVTNYPLI